MGLAWATLELEVWSEPLLIFPVMMRTEAQPGDFEMAVMGKEGDVKQMWNPQNDFEVKQAKKQFDDYRKEKYVAFRVDKEGNKGEQMTEFDPTAAKMIFVPAFQGG